MVPMSHHDWCSKVPGIRKIVMAYEIKSLTNTCMCRIFIPYIYQQLSPGVNCGHLFFAMIPTCEPTESLPPSPRNAACVCLCFFLGGSKTVTLTPP